MNPMADLNPYNTLGDYQMDPFQFEKKYPLLAWNLSESQKAIFDKASAAGHNINVLIFFGPTGPKLEKISEEVPL